MKRFLVYSLAVLMVLAGATVLAAAEQPGKTMAAVGSELPSEVITEATYPVTPGENPDVAQQRAYVAAMRLAHAKWVEYTGKIPEVAKKNFSIAQLYVAIEALNRPSLVKSEVRTINGEKFYWVQLKNTLDMADFNVVYSNMTDWDYVPTIRMIHKALDANNDAVTALRLQYIYSRSAVDRVSLKKKIEALENRFESVEWTFSGFVAYINNQLDVAGIDLNKAVVSDPDNAEAYYMRGMYFSASGQPDKAIADYTVALKNDPRDFDLYSRRAQMYVAAGNMANAVADYSTCIELRPDSVKSYMARAELYDQSGKDDLALGDYNKVIAFDPKNYQALANRAGVYEQLKEYNLAITDYTALLVINPKDISSLLNRGSCYEAGGNNAKALGDYEQAMTLGVNEPAKFMEIAKKAYANKQYDLAEKALAVCIKYNAADRQAYLLRANCYDAQSNLKAAVADYSEALKINAADTATLMARAADYFALAAADNQYYPLTIADCTGALMLNPDLYDAHLLRGKVLQIQKSYQAAADDYAVCLSIKPTADVYGRMGECYAELGDRNKPRQCYNKAIEMDQSNPQYYWDLAQFFDKIGRAKSDTVRAYNDFIKAAGTNSQWTQQIVTAKERIGKLGGKVD